MVDLNSLISSWFGLLFDYVASLATYQVVPGVSFFSMLIAIGIFTIIVRYFFVKVQG